MHVVSEYIRELASRGGGEKDQPTYQPVQSIRMRTKGPRQLKKKESKQKKEKGKRKEKKARKGRANGKAP